MQQISRLSKTTVFIPRQMSLDRKTIETPEQSFWRELEPIVLGNFMELLEKEVENYEAK
ncbi:MAG: hypothetical protein GYA60_09505 [Candidatus Methanofastidiosa archaeon]|nr:hypothetical protein [Candidatus Methanofastidiosa archaeon]